MMPQGNVSKRVMVLSVEIASNLQRRQDTRIALVMLEENLRHNPEPHYLEVLYSDRRVLTERMFFLEDRIKAGYKEYHKLVFPRPKRRSREQ